MKYTLLIPRKKIYSVNRMLIKMQEPRVTRFSTAQLERMQTARGNVLTSGKAFLLGSVTRFEMYKSKLKEDNVLLQQWATLKKDIVCGKFVEWSGEDGKFVKWSGKDCYLTTKDYPCMRTPSMIQTDQIKDAEKKGLQEEQIVNCGILAVEVHNDVKSDSNDTQENASLHHVKANQGLDVVTIRDSANKLRKGRGPTENSKILFWSNTEMATSHETTEMVENTESAHENKFFFLTYHLDFVKMRPCIVPVSYNTDVQTRLVFMTHATALQMLRQNTSDELKQKSLILLMESPVFPNGHYMTLKKICHKKYITFLERLHTITPEVFDEDDLMNSEGTMDSDSFDYLDPTLWREYQREYHDAMFGKEHVFTYRTVQNGEQKEFWIPPDMNTRGEIEYVLNGKTLGPFSEFNAMIECLQKRTESIAYVYILYDFVSTSPCLLPSEEAAACVVQSASAVIGKRGDEVTLLPPATELNKRVRDDINSVTTRKSAKLPPAKRNSSEKTYRGTIKEILKRQFANSA
jgi:hypothetical protein